MRSPDDIAFKTIVLHTNFLNFFVWKEIKKCILAVVLSSFRSLAKFCYFLWNITNPRLFTDPWSQNLLKLLLHRTSLSLLEHFKLHFSLHGTFNSLVVISFPLVLIKLTPWFFAHFPLLTTKFFLMYKPFLPFICFNSRLTSLTTFDRSRGVKTWRWGKFHTGRHCRYMVTKLYYK